MTAEALRKAAADHRSRTTATNDDRVLPINIDSREAAPAAAGEMAEIKQFLREPLGRQTVILWPTTDLSIAQQQSKAYSAIAGSQPVDLPLEISGPARNTWQQIATSTLTLVNHVESLDMLCNPRDYNPDAYPSLGEFIKKISRDFTAKKMELIKSTRKPLSLTILFASESSDHGVLSNLGSGVRFGFLDGSALIGVTPASEIGRWWANRRGLLTQTIVQLDAHAFCLPPTVSVPVSRRYGPEAARTTLDDHPVSKKSEAEIADYLKRSDFGRHLLGDVDRRSRRGATRARRLARRTRRWWRARISTVVGTSR